MTLAMRVMKMPWFSVVFPWFGDIFLFHCLLFAGAPDKNYRPEDLAAAQGVVGH